MNIEEIVAEQLAPYATDPTHVVLHGDSVKLTPRAALTLSMVVHELATNAAKYGALSTPNGRVEVRWSVDRAVGAADGSPGVARLTWAESGGPPVTPPPAPASAPR